MAQPLVTNKDTWVMHLHVGTRKTPLTVYPTNRKGIFTVVYGSRTWEGLTPALTAATVGHIVLGAKGNVTR
jgi:hypothetical protein